MIHFLVKHFIKDSENVKNIRVRTAYGMLASAVGIGCNVLLFALKLLVGITLNSVSVMADAFNNLSDAGSSIISFIGVKMAEKPPDKDHPFGHGRIEYIAALIISFLVIEVGFTFLKDSFQKILHPEPLTFRTVSLVILIFSIAVKLWMGYFNRKLGKKINSPVMMATATDSISDVVTTSFTVISILIFHFLDWNIDGYVGILVAGIVMWAGIGIAKDTLKPLIGEGVDPALYRRIKELVESYEGITGSHDLIVHSYGPGRNMASIHAEVPNDVDIEISHELIDKIEREVGRELGILLVIHTDPIETRNDHVQFIKSQVEHVLEKIDLRLSFHDFRMVDGAAQINLIFDLVVPYAYSLSDQDEVQLQILTELNRLDPRYQCVITIDKSFIVPEE